MGLQYISFPMQDFGAGIDQLSAENKIADGRSELLLNADPTAEGYLAKRRGYQGHAGNLPLRISRIEYTAAAQDNICFLFDSSVDISSIDFSTVRSTPVIVQGRTKIAHSGDFTSTDSVHYYSGFTVQNKKEFQSGTHTETVLGADHGGSAYQFVGLAESTSNLNNSNSQFYADSVSIDQATADVDVLYTNGGAPFKGYIILKDKAPVAGSSYATAPTACAVGVTTFSITAVTHGLANFNIIAKVFHDDGLSFIEILPESLVINPDGSVDVTINNTTLASINVVVLLSAAPAANIKSGTVGSGATDTVTLDLDNDFVFVGCYLEQSPSGPRELVIPDSIAVDSTLRQATVSFTNSMPIGANFYLYFETAPITTNKLCVTGAQIMSGYTEDNPQLTLWGLDHAEIYGPNPSSNRPGWVNHIDSYRSAADNRLVAGLGGNLFQAGGSADAYLLPTLTPWIRNRVSAATNIGPAFVDDNDSSNRTRGYLSFEGAGTGWGKGTTIEWQSGNLVKYTLNCPNLTVVGTLSTIISTTAGLEDYLTVKQSGYAANDGTFRITAVSNPSADVLEITVENPNRSDADFDEDDAWAECGIFTDRLPLFEDSTFLPEDIIKSNIFGDDTLYTTRSSTIDTLVIDGVNVLGNVPSGLLIVGQRLTSVLPLQDLDNVSSVLNVVRGDMITIGDIERQFRVLWVNPEDDLSVTISDNGDGETANVLLGSDNTDNLAVGQQVNFIRAGVFTGTFTITNVVDDDNFTISTDIEGSAIAGILQGNTIEVDEVATFEDTVDSTTFITVDQRWIPIEAPDDSYDLTPNATYRQLDGELYSEQPILRSVMVSDNLYLSNGVDEVFKFDGSNLYRAGLFRWQPQLFLALDTSPPAPETGTIDIDDVSADLAGGFWDTNKFQVAEEDKNTFAIGDKIRYSTTSPTFTVRNVDSTVSPAAGYIIVDRNIGGTPASGTLRKVNTFRYYFRLNAIDANDNIIASAVTGAEDYVVELVEDTQVRLRLVGMPAWDLYDFDRLEVEVYRTKSDTVAPFYRLVTIPMSFNNGDGYIDYIDTAADDTLVDLDLTSALSGEELGTGWTEPIRAKYVTSLSNRLILGNTKEYPKLDFQFVDTGSRITASTLIGSSLLFRKDNVDTATVTDMTNRVRYEFRGTGSAVTIDASTDVTNNAGVSFTVDSTAHGLVAGDWVYLYHSAVTDGNRLQYAGWFMINSVTTDDFTILHTHSASYTPAVEDVDRYVTATNPEDVPVLLGIDGNYNTLSGNPDVTGAYQFTALKRLANAINASMRKTDITVQTLFTPWMVGNAGSEYNFGQLVVTQPKVFTTVLECVLPTFTAYTLFVNGIKRSSASQVSSSTNLFPSRVLISYPNYAELFDNPGAILDSDSFSAIDVNPADGQEITGIIPFFGESTFGAAQRDTVLLVFKTNSIYLVNIAAKDAGANAVQKVDSRGLGCTAPLSIAPTKNGTMFANESGIYRISQSMDIQFIGRWMDRLWKESVDRDRLSIMTGHYYSNGNKYKLSLPYKTDEENDKVFVYDTTREYQADGYRDGGWTVYDNHNAIGWANLQTEAFWASTKGRVFTLRNTGLKYDFRDDSSPINFEATLRSLDFGEAAIRKAVISAIIQFRVLQSSDGTTVLSATDLTDDFQELDQFRLIEPTDEQDSLSDTGDVKVETLRFSIDRRKCVYMQLKVSNSTIDEPLEICGISFRVSGLKQLGIAEAAST